MLLQLRVLNQLITNTKQGSTCVDLPSLIAELIRIQTTMEHLANAQEKEKVEEQAHAARQQGLRELVYRIQDACAHASRTYHSDPSGGTDSFYKCDICGKETKN